MTLAWINWVSLVRAIVEMKHSSWASPRNVESLPLVTVDVEYAVVGMRTHTYRLRYPRTHLLIACSLSGWDWARFIRWSTYWAARSRASKSLLDSKLIIEVKTLTSCSLISRDLPWVLSRSWFWTCLICLIRLLISGLLLNTMSVRMVRAIVWGDLAQHELVPFGGWLLILHRFELQIIR